MPLDRIPFFERLAGHHRVILAGMGGGFDVFCALPLFFALRRRGHDVHLANLSFTALDRVDGERFAQGAVTVTADSAGPHRYFPEGHLARWFRSRGEETPVHCFPRGGAEPLAEAWRALAGRLEPDAVVGVDGGTDSLMRGDESGLGTPEEEAANLFAIAGLGAPQRLMVCLGFGIDHYHGVCHAHFLEAVAALSRAGAWLGSWPLLAGSEEERLWREAAEFTFAGMPQHPSIVTASLLSAVEGAYGDVHRIHRTRGSRLWINPLMTLYWAFDLEAVARRNLYLDRIAGTRTWEELRAAITDFRLGLEAVRPQEPIPV